VFIFSFNIYLLGSGKSTIYSLLLRYYDVEQGEILINGRDIRKLSVNWMRKQIGIVSQEPTLFNVSIIDNIYYGDIQNEKARNEKNC
jgi:ATP-binding cassette, subfamily B, bacterial